MTKELCQVNHLDSASAPVLPLEMHQLVIRLDHGEETLPGVGEVSRVIIKTLGLSALRLRNPESGCS